MQVSQLQALLESYSAALADAGATDAATLLRNVGNSLRKGGTLATAKLLSAIEKIGFEKAAEEAPLLGHFAPVLEHFIRLLKQAGAKQASVVDLELLLDLSRRHSEVSLGSFELAVQRSVASASRRKPPPGATTVDSKQLIDSYLRRLEGALGNDALFRTVFRELSDDKNISKVEAIEIASRFFEPVAPSSTRPKALQKILYRHEKLLESRAASSSIGGRAA
jgi:hypothetical protein